MAIFEGGCLCGGVRFEVEGEPDAVRYCHCTSCKKLSGSGHTANLRVPSDAVRIVSGQELLRTYQPPEGSAKTFCSACGSNLFGGGWPSSERASVRVTTLDEPPELTPAGHLFTRSLAPWETLPDDGAERFETTSA
ncbi:MAG: GFA family protein [Gaiellaceae bacterium]|jgi:hypothetical protein